MSAPELLQLAIRAAIERAGIDAAAVEEGIMGCIFAGVKQGPARHDVQAGIPDANGATTINKLCGSGMKATMLAHDLIKAGSGEILLAGGMESMSNAPHVLTKARGGYRLGHGELKDHMFLDGLEDAETGKLMGAFAQDVATERGYTRERLDDSPLLPTSMAATNNGDLDAEMAPVTVTTRQGDTVVSHDEQPFQAKLDKIRHCVLHLLKMAPSQQLTLAPSPMVHQRSS